MIDVPTRNDEVDGKERSPSTEPAGTATIESYETDDGVVFYDAENPLAWVETSRAIVLSDLA